MAVGLDDDAPISVEEISANAATAGSVWHGHLHGWQPVRPKYSEVERHFKSALGSLRDHTEGQLERPSVAMCASSRQLTGELIDGDHPTLHRPGGHGDRIISIRRRRITEIDDAVCGRGDQEPAPVDRREPTSAS